MTAKKGVEPTPILNALHSIQEKEGKLTKASLEEIAKAHNMPIANIFDAVTFYHYFKLDDDSEKKSAICKGPVCSLPGIKGQDLADMRSISCPGLCDSPVPIFADGEFRGTKGVDQVFELPHDTGSKGVIFRDSRKRKGWILDEYIKFGGYGQLQSLINDQNPEKALGVLKESGLLGRGGAGFQLALKWGAVRNAEGSEKYIVCNADEGEPGTLKDRPMLHLEPHLLLEAMAIAGFIVGASHGIIYLRYEYPLAQNILNKAIEAAEDANILGNNINNTDYSFYLSVSRGSGAYICGEETSLLNSLEGKRPWPRERPPFPTTSGLWGKPTAVNNVETLSVVPRILENGAKWFQSVGLGEGNFGSKLYSVSGDVNRPGNFELPLGVTVRELILNHAGGVVGGGKVKAFTLGGISGGMLSGDFLDLTLDFKKPQEYDTFLGSGALVVLGEDSCVVDFARSCAVFFEDESCGKCYPCRIGAVRMRELMDGISGDSSLIPDTLDHIKEIGDVMTTASACGLGQSAPKVLQGMVKYFSEELDFHITKRVCPTNVCGFDANNTS